MNDLSTVPLPREATAVPAVTAAASPGRPSSAPSRPRPAPGSTPAAVERLPFDLSALDQEGVLINVDAAGFGLLDRRLDWQAWASRSQRDRHRLPAPALRLLPDRYRLPLLRARPAPTPPCTATATASAWWRPCWRRPPCWLPGRLRGLRGGVPGGAGRPGRPPGAPCSTATRAVRDEVVVTFLGIAAASARRLQATGQPRPRRLPGGGRAGRGRRRALPDDLRRRLVLRYRVGVFWLGSELAAEQARARGARATWSGRRAGAPGARRAGRPRARRPGRAVGRGGARPPPAGAEAEERRRRRR